jgi:acyl carrier protein
LGLESIDALEMVFDLEEKFGIQIPYNANSTEATFTTVGDVVTAIQRLVDESRSADAAT